MSLHRQLNFMRSEEEYSRIFLLQKLRLREMVACPEVTYLPLEPLLFSVSPAPAPPPPAVWLLVLPRPAQLGHKARWHWGRENPRERTFQEEGTAQAEARRRDGAESGQDT